MLSGKRATRLTRPEAVVIAVMLVVAAGVIAFKVVQQMRIGPYWDTFSFLSNAAEFAGRGFGYTELHRPPVLSLVTAAFFALGAPLHEAVIMWVDGFVSLTGLLAFYLIVRRRFEPPLAAVGALALLAVQPLWQYLGIGYTDFFSVTLSMWLLWACIRATEDDPAWYLLAGPLFTAAVMSRYTAILALFPVAVWIVLRWKPFHQAKYIGGAVALAVATYVVPGAKFYSERFGDVLFPFLVAFGMYEDFSAPTDQFATQPAAGWLARSLPDFLGGDRIGLITYVTILVAGLGLALGLIAYFSNHRPRPARLALGLLSCVPVALAEFGGAGLVARQVTIPIAVLGLWSALAPYESDPISRKVTVRAALNAVMLAWLLAYFDFHGHERIHVPRYVITMAPPIVFFIVQGWHQFVADIRRTMGDTRVAARPWVRAIAPAGIALFVIPAIVTAMSATSAEAPDAWTAAAKETSAYLREQPGIEGARVLSDLWPITAWYTRIPVKAMQRFDDEDAYQHSLDKHNADYYVTIHGGEYAGYTEAAVSEDARVLARTWGAASDGPAVPYLGKAWDNYLESVTGYTFYLTGDQGPQEWGEMVFLDAMSAEELSAYDAVAVYGVRWHDRYAGEAALLEYLDRGGVVVIDASGNLGKGPFELENTVMFETVMQRAALDTDAQIDAGERLEAIDPALDDVDAAPFADIDGGPWYGAAYTPLPGTEDLEVLATAGGKPLVAMRRVGEGRVYWIGYNLVWHAFITDSADEQALIAAVFKDALGDTAAP